jgi:FkbM family methyltransferase
MPVSIRTTSSNSSPYTLQLALRSYMAAIEVKRKAKLPHYVQQRTFARMVRRALRSLGFDLVRYPTRRRTLEEAFVQLRRVGFQPATVIDIGVGDGTPELYRVFPESRFLLVEPQPEYEATLKRILEDIDGEYALAAAVSHNGTVCLRVPDDHREGATVFRDNSRTRWTELEVAAVRLDDLAVQHGFSGPFLIKADTQGSELEALSGAPHTLEQTEVVVVEISLFDFYQGGPQLADVVQFMKGRGFVAYDIIGGHERPLDGALAQLDFVFVRELGRFRRSMRYLH